MPRIADGIRDISFVGHIRPDILRISPPTANREHPHKFAGVTQGSIVMDGRIDA